MIFIIALVAFLFVNTLLVVIHEFGHFITAKKSGVKVEEFAIGMGPKIYSKQYGETVYSLRAFPIGGYVSMLGQDDFDSGKNDDVKSKETLDPRNYAAKSPWIRSLIVMMGVVMNFAFAVVIYTIIGLFSNFTYVFPQISTYENNKYVFGDQRDINIGYISGSVYKDTQISEKIAISKVNGVKYKTQDELFKVINENRGKEIKLETTSILGGSFTEKTIKPTSDATQSTLFLAVAKDSPAEKAGIKESFLVYTVDDKNIKDSDAFRAYLNEVKDKEVEIKGIYLLNNEEKTFKVTPKLDDKDGKYKVGVNLSSSYFFKNADKGVVLIDESQANIREYHGIGKVFSGVFETYNLSQYSLSLLGKSIGTSIEKKDIQPVAEATSGPIGIFATIQTLVQTLGWFGLLVILAIISLSLAVFNLMPFPGLDGWHLYNNIFEGITGKRLPTKIFNIVTIVGFGILLFLVLLITIKDVFTFIIK